MNRLEASTTILGPKKRTKSNEDLIRDVIRGGCSVDPTAATSVDALVLPRDVLVVLVAVSLSFVFVCDITMVMLMGRESGTVVHFRILATYASEESGAKRKIHSRHFNDFIFPKVLPSDRSPRGSEDRRCWSLDHSS
jgi:hypothetical protein